MVKIGTSGFSFPDWVGPIYPSNIKKNDMLVFYQNELCFKIRRQILVLMLLFLTMFPACIRVFGSCISIINPDAKIKAYKNFENKGKNSTGMTSLMYAAGNDDYRIVQKLLDQGVEINAKDKKGQTALIIASTNNHIDTVKVLLAKNADINLRNNHGATALIMAAMRGHVATVKALLDKDPDLTVKTNGGLTALDAAELDGHTKIAAILKQHSAINNIMPKPIRRLGLPVRAD